MYNTKINPIQKLCTASQWKSLVGNYETNQRNIMNDGDTEDFKPVVKFFDPFGAATWLVSESSPDGQAFGFCDLGQGMPELGYFSLKELCQIGRIERDLHFKPKKSLLEYALEADKKGRIVA